MEKPFLIYVNGIRVKVNTSDIIYVAVLENYVELKLINNRSKRIKCSLKKFINDLPAGKFLRIHRNYIVATAHIESVGKDVKMNTGVELPLSEEYREIFFSHFILY